MLIRMTEGIGMDNDRLLVSARTARWGGREEILWDEFAQNRESRRVNLNPATLCHLRYDTVEFYSIYPEDNGIITRYTEPWANGFVFTVDYHYQWRPDRRLWEWRRRYNLGGWSGWEVL